MRTRVFQAIFFAIISALAFAPNAYAGDAATVVLKSGVVLTLQNGFKAISDGMRNLKNHGSENFPVEVNIESTTMFINLGDVAVVCRDDCRSITITRPKSDERR